MANAPMKQGPTTTRVQNNLKTLRKARGLDLADVSARLSELGHPISVSVLSKIEVGNRRIDVDDLVALALALNVSPTRLLLTADADSETTVALTQAESTTARDAWRWARGLAPLRAESTRDEQTFRLENRPDDRGQTLSLELIAEHERELHAVMKSVREAESSTGLTLEAILAYVDASARLLNTLRESGTLDKLKQLGTSKGPK